MNQKDKQETRGIIRMDDSYRNTARIKVVGVGGAGGNAINRMVRSGFSGVEFIAINTDQMALDNSLADVKIPIGQTITKGLGAGAKPDRGYQAIQEDRAAVEAALDGADMVFITAGMGGGTGTGAAPVVAEIAKKKGILSVAVVTKPFIFEGPVRMKNCAAGIEALRGQVDTIIVIQNQKILSIANKQTQISQAFQMADEVLNNAVRGICDIILTHGTIQVDFADICTIMENGGNALMGTGVAEGENRAIQAAERAIHSPLLDDISIAGATGVLVNISHGEDLSIHELNDVMNYIYESVGEENQPNIIWGQVERPDMTGKISVTVIAAGFHKNGQQLLEAHDPLVHHKSVAESTPKSESSPAQVRVASPTASQPVHSPSAHPDTSAQQSVARPTLAIPEVAPAGGSASGRFAAYMPEEEVLHQPSPFKAPSRPTAEQPAYLRRNEFASPRPGDADFAASAPVTGPTYRPGTEAASGNLDLEDIDYEAPAFLRHQL